MQQLDNRSSGPENASADAGFKLPDAAEAASAPSAVASAVPNPAPSQVASTGIEGVQQAADTSARDLTLGGGIFLVLLLVFFFARGAYVNHLVARRVAPASAGSAGWLMWIGLAFLSASVVLALINPSQYLRIAITGPLVLVGSGTLIAAVLTGRR
jgi:hypothetical protein